MPTLLGLVLAAMLFDLVGKKFGGRLASFLRATYYLPQILPVAIAAIVIGWILRPENGALNTMLEAVGLGSLQHNWLGSPDTALLSIMVVMVWVQLGYPVVIFMAALQRVDPELYEAAELDGANWFQRFRSITRQHHPPRDLRRHAHLHDRGAEGVRPDLHAHPRRPGQRDHRAELLLVQRVLPEPAGRLRRHHRDRADRRHRHRRDLLHQAPRTAPSEQRASADGHDRRRTRPEPTHRPAAPDAARTVGDAAQAKRARDWVCCSSAIVVGACSSRCRSC